MNIRRELCRYGKLLVEKGLVTGPGGNLSAREGDTVYLSPSGFCLAEIGADDWFAVDLASGRALDEPKAGLRPTCETTMHLGCYLQDPAIRAVLHIHPVLSTALASAGVPFRAVFPDFVALLGPEVPVVAYTPPGGTEIRRAVTGQLAAGATAVLLKNHGAVAVGATLKEAYFRCLVLEEAAAFIQAFRAAGGQDPYLTAEQVRGIAAMECEDYRRLLLKQAR